MTVAIGATGAWLTWKILRTIRKMTMTEEWEWVGEGQEVIHLINRRDVREAGDVMAQSLCRKAALAYSPEHQVRLPRKKLCGHCVNALLRVTPSEGPAHPPTSAAASRA